MKKLVLFTLFLLFFLSSCYNAPTSVSEKALNSDFTIKYRRTVALTGENLYITFADVVKDTRTSAAKDGTANIELLVRQGIDQQTDTVQTEFPQSIVTIGKINNSYLFWVKDVQPSSKQGTNISKSDYILTLHVSHFTYGFADSTIKNKTGLYGQAYVSPTAPVERIGYVYYKPLPITLKIVDSNQDTVLVSTDSTGRFIDYSPPGTYKILSANGNRFPYLTGNPVNCTVSKDDMTYKVLQFDSGLR